MIKGFAHNALKVSDMQKSLHFYCDLAGLEKAFEINDQQNNPWIVYLKVCGGKFLELFYGGVQDPCNHYAGDLTGYHHFCFEVDDIREVCRKMKENGLLETYEPFKGKDGNLSCWTHDPDGNAVEFVQYMPGSDHVKYEGDAAATTPVDASRPGKHTLKGIGHISFVVEDMEKALNFYCNILGLKKAFEKDWEGKPWLVYVNVAPRQYIELFYGGRRKYKNPDAAGGDHLCFEVGDIHEIAERLTGCGVHLDVKPMQGKDTNYQCWAKDPDGNRIEFMQMGPDSPQGKA